MLTQYGVLPYRVDGEGGLEILLITSKERRRWVIPKGNPIPFFLNYESAAREAFEEAGVEGRVATVPVGHLSLRQEAALGRGRGGDRHRLSAAGDSRGRRLARAPASGSGAGSPAPRRPRRSRSPSCRR